MNDEIDVYEAEDDVAEILWNFFGNGGHSTFSEASVADTEDYYIVAEDILEVIQEYINSV